MSTIRRINLYAGPGAGKSTLAAHIYSQFKLQFKNIELIREFVKHWSYLGLKVESFDQLYIFAQQIREEDLVLRNNVDLIITDSPVMLAVCYCQLYNLHGWKGLKLIEQDFEEKYPSLNIYLKRNPNKPYNQLGRFQTYEDAVKVDSMIKDMLDESKREYVEYFANDYEGIMNYIKGIIP